MDTDEHRSDGPNLLLMAVPVSVLTIDTPCGDSPACPLRLRLDQLLRAEVTRRLGSRRNDVVPSPGTGSIQFFSAKAMGAAPPSLPRPGITVCDTMTRTSSAVSSNMKSEGKRLRLRRTACFNARVCTP
jgi:hypothetical protein